MSGLYNIVTIYVTGALMLVCGMMLLFAAVPATPLLGNYRRARRTMAGAYLVFFALMVVELLLQSPETEASDTTLMRAITLSVAATQAFLFTFATLALLETRWPGWKYLAHEAVYVALFVVAILSVYALCPEETFANAYYVFAAVYLAAMVRYTFMFVRSYRRFRRRMNNFFSGDEADRMRWIAVSFFGALAVGVMALFSALFISPLTMVLFAVVFDVFYTWFAIRFIGYAVRFPAIEEAMEDPAPEGAPQPETGKSSGGNGKIAASANFDALEQRVEQWVADKGYTDKHVTVKTLYPQLSSNRYYLSNYINTAKGKTFNEWINGLRIAEAKRLLSEHPQMKISDVASHTGFATTSHFGKLFRDIAQSSPSVWRERQKYSLNGKK